MCILSALMYERLVRNMSSLQPDVYAQGGHILYSRAFKLRMSGNKLHCLIDDVEHNLWNVQNFTVFRATLWCYAFDYLNKISSNQLKLNTV